MNKSFELQRAEIINLARLAKEKPFGLLIKTTVSLGLPCGTALKKLSKHQTKNEDAIFHELLNLLNKEMTPDEITLLHTKLHQLKVL